jgi:hypothetical protein
MVFYLNVRFGDGKIYVSQNPSSPLTIDVETLPLLLKFELHKLLSHVSGNEKVE